MLVKAISIFDNLSTGYVRRSVLLALRPPRADLRTLASRPRIAPHGRNDAGELQRATDGRTTRAAASSTANGSSSAMVCGCYGSLPY